MELSDDERAVLDLEASWWTGTGPKHEVVAARLGLSVTRYHQILAEVIDRPEAERHDPLVVRRLRRQRDRRRVAHREPRPAADDSRGP